MSEIRAKPMTNIVMIPGRFFTFNTSREGAYSRQGAYSGQGAYLINRAAMGRAWFLLCTGFIFFSFFFLSVARPKPPLGQIVIGTESRNL